MLYSLILGQLLVACGGKESDTSQPMVEPAQEASPEPSTDTGITEDGVEALREGNLVITEIMKNPCVIGEDVDGDGNLDCTLEDEAGEWFEIYNNTSESQNLKGLIVTDDDLPEEVFTVADDVIVPAGGYVVFGNNGDSASNGGYTSGYAYIGGDAGFKLGNGTDGIVLSNANGVIDSVVYTDADFPDNKGYSLTLIPSVLDATQNDDGANWCISADQYGDGDFGTPGSANTCSE